VTTESESGRIDTLAEIEGVVETENGTEIEDLHDAMQDETTTIDPQGEITEICSMIEEVVADAEVAGAVTAMTLELEAEERGRRVHPPHPRRRSRPQT
jgi:hypothetical protein